MRVLDIDFGGSTIAVRNGKGGKGRTTVLPDSLKAPLRDHLRRVQATRARDLAEGWGRVQMPDALDREYPSAAAE